LLGNKIVIKRNIGGSSPCKFLIIYGGYNWQLADSEAYGEGLLAKFKEVGIHNIVAVAGPQDPGYNAQEIGNSHLAALLHNSCPNSKDNFAVIVCQSSGAFVANEFLGYLYGSIGNKHWNNRAIYYDQDGAGGVPTSAQHNLAHVFYVSAIRKGLTSMNYYSMESANSGAVGNHNFIQINLSPSHCQTVQCGHMALIRNIPHSPYTWTVPADMRTGNYQFQQFDQTWNTVKTVASG